MRKYSKALVSLCHFSAAQGAGILFAFCSGMDYRTDCRTPGAFF